MIILISLIALILVVLISAYYYNRIISLWNNIENAWAQIDVQLKKRNDMIPNLIETVKGYMKHEKSIFENIAKYRTAMINASSVEEKAKINNQISKALKSIFALSENYPKLEASENFKMLQEEISNIESKIAYARQYYNDSVLSFNNLITTIPGKWFASLTGKNQKKTYFEATEEERKNVKVQF